MDQQITFWQDSISIHQSALLRSLSKDFDQKITLAVWEELPPERKNVGWTRPDLGDVQIIIRPDCKKTKELLLRNPSFTKHVFSGSRGHPFVKTALKASFSTPAIISIYSEAFYRKGVLGRLRLVRSKFDAVKLSRRILFLLAIGRNGMKWYTQSGFPSARVFPFGYFVEKPRQNNIPLISKEFRDLFNIVYVGQLLHRKGWDTLLNALIGIDKRLWRLHIVGDGEDRNKFISLCEDLSLLNNVILYGVQPNINAIDILRRSDLLVLPSRWDGWGAVINEALMSGVPVISSDQCGSSVLLDGDKRGEVFHSDSVRELHTTLNRWISKGKYSIYQRQELIEWSKCISGESGASYFMAIMSSVENGGERPIPPWLK
jgi:glycosyltransferase involved in cell wall biosynthesis